MREMAYTGRRMYADEAKETGLVSDTLISRRNACSQMNLLKSLPQNHL